ncbi:unnamed protein product [Cylicocyclus nassatus]|uniref:Uncharacterized protein n=1 Tax=Cylicocyclus nassatus TaxID=53992 RepID=A0AA36GPZ2_CYLNA|nr:unnamed protein product [Cylicocyclus nassatus]
MELGPESKDFKKEDVSPPSDETEQSRHPMITRSRARYGVKKKSTSFRLVALLNMVTLAVFRISVSFYLVYWAIVQIPVIPWLHTILTIFVIFSLFCSNAVLAYRVMAADGLFGQSRARKPPPPVNSTTVDVETGAREEYADEEEDLQHEVAVQTTDARVLVDDVTQTVS